MPTIEYRNAKGERIPGTTTVIGQNCGWNKGPLMWWANQEGLAGRKHTDTSQRAADAGTLAHAMVEAHIRGRDWSPNGHPPELVARAQGAFEAFCEWEMGTRLRIVATEVHLVSERHQFGATPDAVALINDRLRMPDWKTGKGTYADHVMQLAAYVHIWEEVTAMPLDGADLCRFSPDGNFVHHFWPKSLLAPAWQAFKYLRALHDLKKPLDQLAK